MRRIECKKLVDASPEHRYCLIWQIKHQIETVVGDTVFPKKPDGSFYLLKAVDSIQKSEFIFIRRLNAEADSFYMVFCNGLDQLLADGFGVALDGKFAECLKIDMLG